jgi:hypothetical protein
LAGWTRWTSTGRRTPGRQIRRPALAVVEALSPDPGYNLATGITYSAPLSYGSLSRDLRAPAPPQRASGLSHVQEAPTGRRDDYSEGRGAGGMCRTCTVASSLDRSPRRPSIRARAALSSSRPRPFSVPSARATFGGSTEIAAFGRKAKLNACKAGLRAPNACTTAATAVSRSCLRAAIRSRLRRSSPKPHDEELMWQCRECGARTDE